MQTLIIGNGFDIDHNLPTKYKDFLGFIEEINYVKEIGKNKIEKIYLADTDLKRYIKDVFLLPDKNNIKCEILSLIDENMWIKYFLGVKEAFGDNWIDFEAEISQVVQELENVKDYVIAETKKGSRTIVVPDYMKRKLDRLSFDAVPVYRGGSPIAVNEYISEWVKHLDELIRLLEIYLCDYVKNIKIEYYSPDIFNLNPDHIISFNYTDTYERLYSYGRRQIKYNYIHGKAFISNTVDTCNMVLGIDEYLDESRRNKKTEFIQFKKYYQRVRKKTDCEYVYWFDNQGKPEKSQDYNDEVYIFGHSLDITDGDVLASVFKCPNTRIVIFYYDNTVYGKQISNLVALLGQDVLLSKVYGREPSIVFKKQQEHRKISNSGFEVVHDIYKLRQLYNYNNVQAQEIVNDIINKINDCNISYFESQENVVDMYNSLQEIGLAEENKSKLLSFAKVIYDDKLNGKKKTIDASKWDYCDYDGYNCCNRKTSKFIDEINNYNVEQYEKQVFTIRDEAEQEEKHLLYPDELEDDYSIENYKNTFKYAMNKLNSSTINNTRPILNSLVTIAMNLNINEIKTFYTEMLKRAKNPILHSRINYILACYNEELYMENQSRQYYESMGE